MPIIAGLAHHARTVDALLADTYGEAEWSPKLDGTSELVLTILSQHTSDINSGAAFDALRDHCHSDWNAVSAMPVEELTQVIRSAGLSNIKARRIQRVLREILDRRGSLDLRFLKNLPIADGRAWLTSLPGVGPKTAACVLLFSYGLPVMPVDTHVHRVSGRLGLIGPKVTADRAHDLLATLVPPERVYAFHINLIRHGRQVCKAGVPRCHLCPLTRHCDYFQSRITTTTEQVSRTAPAKKGRTDRAT
ncbi:MAG: endonuclease III [Chloroflexia bacterium]|nr:endonuclease III [Chloroflexia bacterium]